MSNQVVKKATTVWPLVLLSLFTVNILLFQSHYLGKAIFPWDFIGGYHYQSLSWYLDSGWFHVEPYVPWGGGGFPAAWSLQNGSYYLPLAILDGLNVPYTLKMAVILQCLHHVFGMAGQYLLGRRFGAGWVAALFAALLFGAGVTYFSNAQHVDIIRGIAWVPWVLLVLMPFARGGTALSSKLAAYRFTFVLAARIIVLHQFSVAAYPGIIATIVPFLAIWTTVWNWAGLRDFLTLLKSRLQRKKITKNPTPTPINRWQSADVVGLVLALIIAALVLTPKFLPFIDIQIADGSLQPSALAAGFSVRETALILSTFFGDYEGNLPHHYTMNSLWLSPFAVAIVVASGFVSRSHKILTLFLLGAVLYFIFDLMVGVRLPRDLVSRFPITDHRGLLHALFCIVIALSVTSAYPKAGPVLNRIFSRPLQLLAATIVTVAGVAIIRTTVSPGNTVALVATYGVIILLLLVAARFLGNRIAYTGAIGGVILLASYSVHYDSQRSWMTGHDYTDSSAFYGPRYESVPAGQRDWSGGDYRAPRFVAEALPGWLSNEYATAHFNGDYGLEGYNNLKSSRTVNMRKARLLASPELEPFYQNFMLQRSQILTATPDADVATVLMSWTDLSCDDAAICYMSGDPDVAVQWVGFERDAFRFAVSGLDQPTQFIINENAFPGWALTAQTSLGRVDLPLIPNDLGLISVEVPVGTTAVSARYSRSIYKVSGLLAGLGLFLWLIVSAIILGRGFRAQKLRHVQSETDKTVSSDVTDESAR